MFNAARERFRCIWPFMGPIDKIRAIWYFYQWRAAERVSEWLHKHYDRLRAGKEREDG